MGDIRAHQHTHGGQPVAAVLATVKDSEEPEWFEEPVEGGRIRVNRRRQLRRMHGSAGQPIGHPEGSKDVQQLRRLISAKESGESIS
ncbi:hypothetical protein Vau01_113660 [Virgisporangium aurantiacum]|uniref:Uncharacterized protein n=1 Tax=Virgisporangium aurantiacum TaxID=175570 RepID=A0A8J4E6A0_9ACTN|nr:hypothetical protein Vau01_113660 [Virgisporangium aurantiacum]